MKVAKLILSSLVIFAAMPALALECGIGQRLIFKDINNCSVKRERPAQAQTSSGVTNPGMYIIFYDMVCRDSCGHDFRVIGELDWDCAGKQELIGENAMSETYQDDSKKLSSCEGPVSDVILGAEAELYNKFDQHIWREVSTKPKLPPRAKYQTYYPGSQENVTAEPAIPPRVSLPPCVPAKYKVCF